jgi:hypothetical protein
MKYDPRVPYALGGLALAAAVACAAYAQSPIVDAVANKVVQKYQSSSCEQLAAERQAPKTAAKAAAEQRAGQLLRQDAQARAAFVAKVAAPVVDKMIVCGFVP